MFRSWRKQLGFLAVAAIMSGALVSSAQAVSPPNIITYQGRVLNANGVPVSNTSLSMSFALYTAATGGSCVWSNSSVTCASVTARTVTLTTGLFTENLGDTSVTYAAISDAIFADNATLYLEVIIAGETLTPRRQITAAPYALNAETLDGIDSTTLQLFETGSSRTFEDDAPVIIGTNAAFTYGSGGVGDLRVDDELEVMGDGYIDNDLVVGASTSVTETITNAAFSLSGNDLFVASDLGVEGNIYVDGTLDIVGAITVADVTCTDCLDFTEFSDTLALDASTSIAMDGSESFTLTNGGTGNVVVNLSSTGDLVVQDNGTAVLTIADDDVLSYATDLITTTAVTFTGNSLTTGSLLNLSSTGLTTGSAISVTATNANTANTAARLSQFAFTNSQSTLANADIVGLMLNFTNNPSVAGNTERAMQINNVATSNTTDNAVSSLLLLDNADTSTTGSTVVTDALSITVSGAITDGIIDAIDATDTNITNAFNFGTNTILGTTGNIDMTNFDVTGSSGNITTSGDLAVNGDDITSDGTLTIDSSGTIRLGTDDDLLPQLGAGDADIGASGTRWDNLYAVAGSFSGTATVGDLACTDCLDFAEFADILALDASTEIAMDGSENLTITNGGTGNISFNLTSTGDVAFNGGGISVFSITDSGTAVFTGFAQHNTDIDLQLDGSENFSILNPTASTEVIDIIVTANANDALELNLTLGNDADQDTVNALEILVTSTATGDADIVRGLAISDVVSPQAIVTEVGLLIGSGWDTNLSFADITSIIGLQEGGSLVVNDGINALMTLTDNGSDGVLAIDHISTSASSVDLYDVAVTKTIDVGGVTADAADTINIATNNTTADTISIGNSAAGTNVTVTAGGTIDLEGTVNIDLTTIAAAQFAVCHTNSDTNDEPIGDCSGAPIADYAEQYPVAAGIEYGDIVVPGTREVTTSHGETIVQLVKSSQAYQGPIVGIVSNNYGDFTSAGYNIAADETPMPVALVGRVPVKVTAEGGSILVGDYLTTSSTAGKAMKSTKAGRVIGMALEDWDGISETVMVQVNNSWSMGEVLEEDGTSTLTTSNVVVAQVDTATSEEPSFDSYGLALRGSVWNGSEAQTVEMMLHNVVETPDTYRLSIRNTAETEVAYITNEGTMKIAGDMVIGGHVYPSDRGTAQTEKYIYYDGSPGPGGDFMRTNAKGWSTGSYDFAGMFSSDEELVSGDVVVFAGSGETVQRSTGADGEQLAGIVSTRPGFLAGENVDGAYPIALAGRVPTKVSVGNGAIVVGDPLTASSTAGVAMKASDAGQIIGYALESYTGSESDNLVLVYVNLGYWSGEAQTITIVQNAASEISSDAQSFSAINMSGNIYMGTYSILSIGRLESVSGIWSIESDGTIRTEGSLKTVTESYQGIDVETIAMTSPESVITLTGTSTLVAGQAEVRFEDVDPEFNDVISAIAPIRVIVTPSGPVSLYVSEKDQNHFIVQRFVGSADVEFDWIVTGYRKGFEPEEEDEEEQVEEVVEALEVVEVEETDDPSILSDPEESIVQTEEEPEPAVEEPAAEEETTTPESPEETLVDSAIEDDGGQGAEPSDVVIE